MEGVPSNSPTYGQGLFFLKKFKKTSSKLLTFSVYRDII
nr:MAG TPA: hypothetical protein [Caudoviricetes sp.]DAV01493.1 MAG TPA: hypothetical protein [Bacteriophage sp.]